MGVVLRAAVGVDLVDFETSVPVSLEALFWKIREFEGIPTMQGCLFVNVLYKHKEINRDFHEVCMPGI